RTIAAQRIAVQQIEHRPTRRDQHRAVELNRVVDIGEPAAAIAAPAGAEPARAATAPAPAAGARLVPAALSGRGAGRALAAADPVAKLGHAFGIDLALLVAEPRLHFLGQIGDHLFGGLARLTGGRGSAELFAHLLEALGIEPSGARAAGSSGAGGAA